MAYCQRAGPAIRLWRHDPDLAGRAADCQTSGSSGPGQRYSERPAGYQQQSTSIRLTRCDSKTAQCGLPRQCHICRQGQLATGRSVDRSGFITFIDVAAWGWANVIINGGKLNAWANLYAKCPTCCVTATRLLIRWQQAGAEQCQRAINNSYAPHVLNPMTNAVEPRFEDTPLNTFTILREPSKAAVWRLTAVHLWRTIAATTNTGTGYIIQIPQQSSDINTSGVVQVIIPAQTVRQNSITGQAKVSRSNWTS